MYHWLPTVLLAVGVYALQQPVIHRDVAIIGGGSSGVHAAITLKDQGVSNIVIEKTQSIGGHADTIAHPETGAAIDIGVILWHTNFDPSAGGGSTASYDLTTGQATESPALSAEDRAAAFVNYANFLLQYLELGKGIFLPEPVSEDLVAPLREIAAKYNFTVAIQTLYEFNPGLGDFLSVPVVENARINSLELLQSIQSGFLIPTSRNSSELYGVAQAELLADQSLLLSSAVYASERTNAGVTLEVDTPTGRRIVVAKKLLIAVPPKVDIVGEFLDLTQRESMVFSKFINGAYWTSLVQNSGLPGNVSVANYASDWAYPQLPATYRIDATGYPGMHSVKYGAVRTPDTSPLADDVVQHKVIADLKRLQAQNSDIFEQTEPEFLAFSVHNPFNLQAEPHDTRNGFYRDLYALQGKNSTFWTGASFRAHDSTMLWKFNRDVLLPQVVVKRF